MAVFVCCRLAGVMKTANLFREAVFEMLELEGDRKEALKAPDEAEEGSTGLEEVEHAMAKRKRKG